MAGVWPLGPATLSGRTLTWSTPATPIIPDVSPTIVTQATITPATGPVGTVYTLAIGSATGLPEPTATVVLSLNGTPVTIAGDGTYTSTELGELVYTVTWTNGVSPDTVSVASSEVTLPDTWPIWLPPTAKWGFSAAGVTGLEFYECDWDFARDSVAYAFAPNGDIANAGPNTPISLDLGIFLGSEAENRVVSPSGYLGAEWVKSGVTATENFTYTLLMDSDEEDVTRSITSATGYSVVAGERYSLSALIRPMGTREYVYFKIDVPGFGNNNFGFNTTTGQTTYVPDGYGASIRKLNNGFCLIEVNTIALADFEGYFTIGSSLTPVVDDNPVITAVGDTESGIALVNVQFEQRATASYPVLFQGTRPADVMTMTSTKTFTRLVIEYLNETVTLDPVTGPVVLPVRDDWITSIIAY